MKRVYLFIIYFAFLISCDDLSTKKANQSKRTQTTEEFEKENIYDYLMLDATDRTNLIGQRVIEGSISNTATTASFKNAIIIIKFYSKTDTELGELIKTIYEYFEPNTKKNFKIKVSEPSDTYYVKYYLSNAE